MPMNHNYFLNLVGENVKQFTFIMSFGQFFNANTQIDLFQKRPKPLFQFKNQKSTFVNRE